MAVNTHFWAWPNFNSFANFVPSMTNDGALESSHQGEFVLGLLAGGRHNYKTNYLVQGKQTVDKLLYVKKNKDALILMLKELCSEAAFGVTMELIEYILT